jgi:hypothetical protein
MENPAAQIATTMLQQLGGNMFVVMVGAKNIAWGGQDGHAYLGMNIGRNKSGANYFRVDYMPAQDLYTVSFCKIRGLNSVRVKVVEGVYGDMLQDIFTDFTGMYTKL